LFGKPFLKHTAYFFKSSKLKSYYIRTINDSMR